MTDPTDAMRQAVDTLEQNARRVISDCVYLRRMWDEHPDGPVCDDLIADYRLPDGSVCWGPAYADEVRVGDWVQACHGDTGWHLVEDVRALPYTPEMGGGLSTRRVTYNGTAHDWAPRDAIRVAVFPSQAGDLQRRAVLGDADAVACLEAWGDR